MLRRNGALWSGREGRSPAPVEPAHGSWRDSPGNSRLGPRDYLGRGSCPPLPRRTTRDKVFVFLQQNWTNKMQQTTRRESAYWLQLL